MTLALTPSALSWPWSQKFDLPSIAKTARSSVLLVEVFDSTDRRIATGTGFLISEDGILVTNAHVIRDGFRASAKAENGKAYVVNGVLSYDTSDSTHDLVLLKLGDCDLPPLKLGKSSKIAVGEQVAVIGSPLGLEGSVSDGVVSALRSTNTRRSLLQITAAISPGSSGSPVLNANGEVIGIATLTLLEGQSVNFALPVDVVAYALFKVRFNQSTSKNHRSGILAFADVAMRLGSQAVHDDPDYIAYSKLLYHEGNAVKALEALERVQEKYSNCGEVYADIAFVLVQLDRYAEALPMSRKALELDPTNVIAWGTLGDACMSLEQFPEAETAFKKEIELEHDGAMAPHAWENLYRLYNHLGKKTEAAEAFRRWGDAVH